MTSPVSNALQALGIPYREFVHTAPVTSLEQAAAERGQHPSQVVRSILFRLRAGEYVMVLMAGAGQISWPALRAYLGQSRISMASDEEVLAATGYRIGTVSPIGTATRLRVLADRSVFAHPQISMGSGLRNTAILLASADLSRALPDLEIGDFGGPK
jgi:prolyl-tRNA editing enzyme YbaK/EbsC (Cys-tRNA(Pro) deacylase)